MHVRSRHLHAIALWALLLSLLPLARPARAATFTVTNTLNSGAGSLRWAIDQANASAGADTITFNITGCPGGICTIRPLATLPALTSPGGDGTTIDATTQPGWSSSNRNVILDGSEPALGASHGLIIRSANTTVRGLTVVNFQFESSSTTTGVGIFIGGSSATGNKIYDCYIGTADGVNAAGNGAFGVLVTQGASNNDIGGTGAGQGNVIAGNKKSNVALLDNDTMSTVFVSNNRVAGNRIGTNAAGTAAIANLITSGGLVSGISIEDFAHGNSIGPGNLIGGIIDPNNTNLNIAGIRLFTNAAALEPKIPQGNRIYGNFIGATASGTPIRNEIGIFLAGGIRYGARGTTIGGTADPATERNYIAGNARQGILIQDSNGYATGDTLIANNWIGVAQSQTLVPNGGEGVYIGINASSVKTTVGPGNVISANKSYGIRIKSSNNVVKGNFIGTSVDGSQSSNSNATSITGFANAGASIFIQNGSNNLIGGTSADRNVIAYGGESFTGYTAVNIESSGSTFTGVSHNTSGNIIQENYIGLNAAGTGRLVATVVGNGNGIRIDGSPGNRILNNTIAGTGRAILLVLTNGNQEPNNTLIKGNNIGVNASGGALPNEREGIRLLRGTGATIESNLIANNSPATGASPYPGIYLQGASASGNTIRSNRIINNGRSVSPSSTKGGVEVDGATRITITRSETSQNGGKGIELTNGGNGGLAAPSISAATAGSPPRVTGTACSGCTVEIFTSATQEDFEGPSFLNSGTATGGNFSIDITGCSSYLTATATDGSGNTSTFSAAFLVPNGVCTPPNFTLDAAQPSASQNAAPGATVIYTHRLTNNDSIARTFRVSWSSPGGWAAAPGFVDVTLAGGAFATVPITVTVPSDKPNGTTDAMTVQASTAGVTKPVPAWTDTTTVLAPVLTPANPAISPGQLRQLTPPTPAQVTFTHAVTNTGQQGGAFALTATPVGGLPAGWSIASATLVNPSLGPGVSTQAILTINLPASPLAGQVKIGLQVRETTNNNSAAAEDTIEVSFVPGFSFSAATQPSLSTPPGVTVVFTHTLQNTGNGPDSFTVTATALPTLTVSIDPPNPISLDAGASAAVWVSVGLPAGLDATPPAAPLLVSVTAKRSSAATPTVTRQDSIAIIGSAAPAITPDIPRSAQAGATVIFTNTLKNTGNAAAPFTFTPPPTAPPGWSATAANIDCPASLAPNATCTFRVTVTVPASADGGAYSIGVSATAINTGLPGAPPNVTRGATNTVNIAVVPGVELETDQTKGGDPNTLLTFTHTLTNTGNATDSFTITQELNDPRWDASLTFDSLSNVPRNATRSVTVTLRVPRGVLADLANSGVITITAISRSDPAVRDEVVDTGTINPVDGAALSPGTTKNAEPTDVAPASVVFTHVLTNTGSTQIGYTIAVSNSLASWPAPQVTPNPTPALAPGAAATIAVTVTIPAGTANNITNTTTLRVFKEGTATPQLATASDVTRIGPKFGIFFAPLLNVGTALPGQTRSYTHTLTNIGTSPDTFTLTTTASLGWETFVTPDLIDLGPGETTTVSVTIRVPTSVFSSTIDYATVAVRSLNDPNQKASAQEKTTVGQVGGAALSPPQFRSITPASGQLTLDDYILVNTGNGLDTFDLTVSDNLGWTIAVAPRDVTLIAGGAYPVVRLTVTVPATIGEGTFNQVRITARSRRDPLVSDTVESIFSYPVTRVIPVLDKKTYLPVVLSGR